MSQKALVQSTQEDYNFYVIPAPTLLKAKPVAESVYFQLKSRISAFATLHGRPPSLATILVGDDPASRVYVSKKAQMCATLGLGHKDVILPATSNQSSLLKLIQALNSDDSIDGILVQKPLPTACDAPDIFDSINPLKDVDCFSPTNVGLLHQCRPVVKPCTPGGVMQILSHYKISVSSKNALVIGRSDIVGKPMASLLLAENATVCTAHSKTADLSKLVAWADIVVAAIGKPKALSSNLPWQPHTVVIDVGVNRLDNGTLCGDVDFEKVSTLVKAITPVPGGVGPMTIAMLMENTVTLAEKRALIRTIQKDKGHL